LAGAVSLVLALVTRRSVVPHGPGLLAGSWVTAWVTAWPAAGG
jgi:hypothetical protein